MHKKTKRAALAHLKTRKKLLRWRQLARQLLQGHLSFSQLERSGGGSVHSVLKTAAYLSIKEGIPVPSYLAQPVRQALGPGVALAVAEAPSLVSTLRPRPETPAAEPQEQAPQPAPPAPRAPRRAAAATPSAPRRRTTAAPATTPTETLTPRRGRRSRAAEPPAAAAPAETAQEQPPEAAAAKPARPRVRRTPASPRKTTEEPGTETTPREP
ncbi:MAG: hypothetical protein HYY31_06800 [Chloroflexi bacterium]|nr:hypothetical protein [Chloroflexota bacterium]